ncbi:MAG: PAS domain S-box protein [Rhizobiales bacterium]|nr:PAS domain S-box protein [Hyphomicrobiales bacterium]
MELVAKSVPDAEITSGEALRTVLETALDAVVVMDAEGAVVDWNRMAEATFGWTSSEAVGQLMADLIIPPRYREAHNRGLAHYLDTGQGPILRQRIEITALHKSGREFPIELSVTPTDLAGRTNFLGFLRDISERRRAEELLERQLRDANLLWRVTGLAAQTGSLHDALTASLEAICEMTGWPIGHALIPSEAAPMRLESTAIWRLDSPEKFQMLTEVTAGVEFSIGVGLPGQALQSGEPVWMSNLDTNPAFFRARMSRELGVRAGFAFPVKSAGRVIAVLEFFSEHPARPDPELLLTVRTIGDQVGRVFERIQSEDMLRKEKLALEQEVAERKRVERHQALLLAELNHRVKNMLTVVMGIAAQTARASPSIQSFSESFLGRLSSLAHTYTLLTAANWETTPLGGLAEGLFSSHAVPCGPRLALSGPAVMLEPRAALSMSMILHELITNALKYGALATSDGHISLSWTLERAGDTGRVVIRWREMGVLLNGPPTRAGFGSKMIEATVRHELRGMVIADWRSDGVEYRIEFPSRSLD